MKSQRQKRLPIFIFPEELVLDSEDEAAHKQILTLNAKYDHEPPAKSHKLLLLSFFQNSLHYNTKETVITYN